MLREFAVNPVTRGRIAVLSLRGTDERSLMMRDAIDEARRSQRLALVLPARCRTLNGVVDDVVIRDIWP